MLYNNCYSNIGDDTMPPKAGITKDMIFNAAFKLVREQGLEILTARSIAQKLNCSTQPIYSLYENMEEIKEAVFSHAVDFALRYMEQYKDEKNEPAMNLAVGCLLFARDERQLFKALFLPSLSWITG
jgi:AcrR family transcriptional regulator